MGQSQSGAAPVSDTSGSQQPAKASAPVPEQPAAAGATVVTIAGANDEAAAEEELLLQQQLSDPNKVARYHHQGMRAKFLTSNDFYSKRGAVLSNDQTSQAMTQCYMYHYVAACDHHPGDFTPNEEFQQCFELLDDNPFARLAALRRVADRYLHDVVVAATECVDDLEAVAENLLSPAILGGRRGTTVGGGRRGRTSTGRKSIRSRSSMVGGSSTKEDSLEADWFAASSDSHGMLAMMDASQEGSISAGSTLGGRSASIHKLRRSRSAGSQRRKGASPGGREGLGGGTADPSHVAIDGLGATIDVAAAAGAGVGNDDDYESRPRETPFGRCWCRDSIFFFMWSHAVAEKWSRAEAKGCRAVVDLLSTSLRVPLTYHVVYKGRCITAQALIPVAAASPLDPTRLSPDWHAAVMGLASAMNLAPYAAAASSTTDLVERVKSTVNTAGASAEVGVVMQQTVVPLPPDVKAFLGRDARRYLLSNANWLPKFPYSDTKRDSNAHRFQRLRVDAFTTLKDYQPSVRAYHPTAAVEDDIDLTRHHSSLVDDEVHAVGLRFLRASTQNSLLSGAHASSSSLLRVDSSMPPSAASLSLSSPHHRNSDVTGSSRASSSSLDHSIVDAFRRRGFNYGQLGVLLMSLLRNVNPPSDMLDDLIVEIMSRGIKSFAHTAMNHGIEEIARPEFAPFRREACSRKDWTRPLRQSTQSITGRFAQLVQFLLSSIVRHPGSKVPRDATRLVEGIPFPSDLYGGVVIPYIYGKFRLCFEDVDLFQGWPVRLRQRIYDRVCKSLGVTIANGSISSVVPIVGAMSVPQPSSTTGGIEAPPSVALWVNRRWEQLSDRLLKNAARRGDWERDGPGLVLLARTQAALPDDAIRVIDEALERFFSESPHVELRWLATSTHLESVETYVEKIQQAVPELAALAPQLSREAIHAMRRLAIAHHDAANSGQAKAILEDATGLCRDLVTATATHRCDLIDALYRSVTDDLIAYKPQPGAAVEELVEMTSLFARHLPDNPSVAGDYISIAVRIMSEARAVLERTREERYRDAVIPPAAAAAMTGETGPFATSSSTAASPSSGNDLSSSSGTVPLLQRVIEYRHTPPILQALSVAEKHLERAMEWLVKGGARDIDGGRTLAHKLLLAQVTLGHCRALMGHTTEAIAQLKDYASDPLRAAPFIMLVLADIHDWIGDTLEADEWIAEAQSMEKEMLAQEVACPVLFAPV